MTRHGMIGTVLIGICLFLAGMAFDRMIPRLDTPMPSVGTRFVDGYGRQWHVVMVKGQGNARELLLWTPAD